MVVILSYVVNVLINFNRPFYKNGFLIDDRVKIVKYNFKGPLFMDLFCIITIWFLNSSMSFNTPVLLGLNVILRVK